MDFSQKHYMKQTKKLVITKVFQRTQEKRIFDYIEYSKLKKKFISFFTHMKQNILALMTYESTLKFGTKKMCLYKFHPLKTTQSNCHKSMLFVG